MDMTHTFWEENSTLQRIKYESCTPSDDSSRIKDDRGIYPCCDTNLNFSTATCSEDDCEYGPYKKNKVTRQDPMSHRIIEKRRRDRMNNCLADLSRLIPTEYLKKGRGRIEKTEIIEMAIKHMKFLQQEHENPNEQYRLGYQECMSEAMRFMVEVEGHFPREAICVRLLNHLQKHCEAISRAPNVPPVAPNSTSEPPMSQHHECIRSNIQVDYPLPKTDPEQNNNKMNGGGGDSGFGSRATGSVAEEYEKHPDGNGALYKYKNSIKMRFNQDNAGHDGVVKRQKMENGRRNSVTSLENQSSSHSSPPSSELCTRISDSEHRRSPSDSALSMSNPLKIEHASRGDLQRFSPIIKNTAAVEMKHNFNIPIFVLHAKGSYYIPLTIDYKTLLPFLQNYDLLEVVPALHSVVLHPVTINVNFQPHGGGYAAATAGKYKSEFGSNWH